MEHRSTDGRPTTAESHRFAARLSQLKQQGSALLVVGRVPPDQYIQACARLLGDDAAGPRRRLFVTTDTDLPSITDRFTATLNQASPKTTRRITWSTQARSTATTPPTDNSHIPTTRVHDEGLAALGIQISAAIKEFDDQVDGLAPAELRLCFDSLDSLLSDFSRAVVFRFLHILIGRLQQVHGMGHFHLPVERNAEVARVFANLFDATIELRLNDTELQQRWHLHEADLTSTWLSMESPRSSE